MFGSAITPFHPAFTAMPTGLEDRFGSLSRALDESDAATIDEESFDADLAGLPDPPAKKQLAPCPLQVPRSTGS